MERLFNYYSVGSTTDEIPEEKIIKNSNSEPTSQMSSPESVMACGLGDARNVSTGTMYPGSLQRGTYENPSEFLTAQATIGSREDAKNSKSPTMPFLKPPLILTMRECLSDEALLTESLLQQIRQYIPVRYRLYSEWQLIYSSAQHGFSLNTLYQNSTSKFSMASPLLTSLSSFHSASLPNTSSMRSEFQKSGGYKPQGPTKFVGPSLLVLKTADSNIFGAYLSEYIRPCINHYGSADCFLWRLEESSSLSSNCKIKAYLATGKNSFFMMSEPSFMAFGCSDGKFGLWLDSELNRGQSNTVSTFQNDVLSREVDFQIIGLELWAVAE